MGKRNLKGRKGESVHFNREITQMLTPKKSFFLSQEFQTNFNFYVGPPLSVAPLPSKYPPQFRTSTGRDYEDPYRGEMEDPYARVLYAADRNKRFSNSHSASRIQSHQGKHCSIFRSIDHKEGKLNYGKNKEIVKV